MKFALLVCCWLCMLWIWGLIIGDIYKSSIKLWVVGGIIGLVISNFLKDFVLSLSDEEAYLYGIPFFIFIIGAFIFLPKEYFGAAKTKEKDK